MPGLLGATLDGPRARNSHAHVVEGLGAAIVQGRHPPGALLPRDDDLAQRFGVSRTILREAVKTLTAKGLLVARSRVGTRVRPRDDWHMLDADVLRWHLEGGTGATFFADLCEMRLGVEPYAAGLAAQRAGPEAVAAMRAALHRLAEAPDRRGFAIADFDLHQAIIDASGNVFMHSVAALIEAALLTSFWISSPAESRESQAESAGDHARIVDRIAARDAAGAEVAMRHVIVVGRDRVSRAL